MSRLRRFFRFAFAAQQECVLLMLKDGADDTRWSDFLDWGPPQPEMS